jgi:hypothetical protein
VADDFWREAVALKRYRSHPIMLVGDEPQSYPSYRDVAVDHKDGATCFTEIAIGPRLSFQEGTRKTDA